MRHGKSNNNTILKSHEGKAGKRESKQWIPLGSKNKSMILWCPDIVPSHLQSLWALLGFEHPSIDVRGARPFIICLRRRLLRQ